MTQALSPLLVTGFYLAMFLLSAGIAWWRGHLPHWFASSSPLTDVFFGLAAGLGVVVCSRLGMRFKALRWLSEEFSVLLQGLRKRDVLLFALGSAFGEEALFRGTLQPEVGLLTATTLFAILHVGPARRFLWWTAFAWVVGLLLGLMATWRGNLLAPITAHFAVNLLNLRYLSRLSPETPQTRDPSSWAEEAPPLEPNLEADPPPLA